MKAFVETNAANLNGAYYLSEVVLPWMPPCLSSIINISKVNRTLQPIVLPKQVCVDLHIHKLGFLVTSLEILAQFP